MIAMLGHALEYRRDTSATNPFLARYQYGYPDLFQSMNYGLISSYWHPLLTFCQYHLKGAVFLSLGGRGQTLKGKIFMAHLLERKPHHARTRLHSTNQCRRTAHIHLGLRVNVF